MNNRWIHDPIGHAEAQDALYETQDWMESFQPDRVEAPWIASAKPGDLFLVKACDRVQSGEVLPLIGFSCGFVCLKWGMGNVSFPVCDVTPVHAPRSIPSTAALAAGQGHVQRATVDRDSKPCSKASA